MAPAADPKLSNYLAALRAEIESSEAQGEEREALLAKFQEAYEKLTSPANRVGVVIRALDGGLFAVALGESEYVSLCDPQVSVDDLHPGRRVRLNEAYAIVGLAEGEGTGALIKVSEVLPDGRFRVGTDQAGQAGRLVNRGQSLEDVAVKAGDEVRLDGSGRFAVEHLARQATQEYFVEEIPEIPWSQVGGQEAAISLIRETIEQPLLHPEIYARFDKKPVKGILLYGPPGCGKTLIGKATAYNLAREYSERKGEEVKECFLHISGPKILNMWLGETERMVREIFANAREKASEGQLVVVFIDEAESILRTRSSGRWMNISNTVVPQFCAEMDGLVSLENVVIILTSNRPDYIDPAILRPERIDRKVKVVRPSRDDAREIFGIYLSDRLPVDPELTKEFDGETSCARKDLIEFATAALWKRSKDTEFLMVQLRNGTSQTLYWSDLVSGALIKSVVDRAKDYAIRRAIADPKTEHGLRRDDLADAMAAEYAENEIFPKSDSAEDWLKLLDLEPESVIGVRPIRASKGADFVRKNVI